MNTDTQPGSIELGAATTTISVNEFHTKYKPIKNHLDDKAGCFGRLFDTQGPEGAFVKQQPGSMVWTLAEDYDGFDIILSGYHLVNRQAYFVCSVPVPDGVEVEVQVYSEEEKALRREEYAIERAHELADENEKLRGLLAAAIHRLAGALDMLADVGTESTRHLERALKVLQAIRIRPLTPHSGTVAVGEQLPAHTKTSPG